MSLQCGCSIYLTATYLLHFQQIYFRYVLECIRLNQETCSLFSLFYLICKYYLPEFLVTRQYQHQLQHYPASPWNSVKRPDLFRKCQFSFFFFALPKLQRNGLIIDFKREKRNKIVFAIPFDCFLWKRISRIRTPSVRSIRIIMSFFGNILHVSQIPRAGR